MKANLIKLRYKIGFGTLLGFVFLFSTVSEAQETKTWETSAPFKNNPEVILKLYDTHAEILPSKEDKIVVRIEYIAEGDNTEDLAKLEKALKDDLLKQNGNTFTITSHFFSTTQKWSFFGFKEMSYVVLKDGEKIFFEDLTFEIKKIKLYVPSEMEFTLEGKYGKADLVFSLAGKTHLDLYDFDLVGKSIQGDLLVESKYSKVRFDKVNNVNLNLYESQFVVAEMNRATIDSKYSEIESVKSNEVTFTGYEDKLTITNLPKIKIDAKYCHVRMGDVPFVEATLYEGSLNLKTTQDLVLTAKYIELYASRLSKLTQIDGYENKLTIESLDTLISTNGKYTQLQIQVFNNYLKMDGYEDHVRINQVHESFSVLQFDGKYMELNLNIQKSAVYRLMGTVNYAEFRLMRDEFKVLYHDKDNELFKFDYIYGGSENPTKQILINGYEVNLFLSNL